MPVQVVSLSRLGNILIPYPGKTVYLHLMEQSVLFVLLTIAVLFNRVF
jgi:hypothetical protein